MTEEGKANWERIFRKYPTWVCHQCGMKHGKAPTDGKWATYHEDVCGVCGATASCTEPRDYGHLKESWRDDR